MHHTIEYLLPSDVASILHLTPAGVKLAVRSGRLRVAAKTRRGVHLFLLKDVQTFEERRGWERTRAACRRPRLQLQPLKPEAPRSTRSAKGDPA